MKTHRHLINALLSTLLAALLTMGCSDNGGKKGSDLDKLGVDTDLGPRKNPAGEALGDDYHPLSKPHRTIAPLSELYFAGLTIDGRNQALLDDQKAGLELLYSDDEESWTGLNVAAGKGDVDGDGYDEIVVVYYVPADKVLKMRVIDRSNGEYVLSRSTVATNVEVNTDTAYGLPHMTAIALGDLDRDGRDEIAYGIGNQLFLIDDSKAGFALKESRVYDQPSDQGGFSMMQLGFGDFNGDGRDQLLVSLSQTDRYLATGRVEWYRYDVSLEEASDSGRLSLDVEYTPHTFVLARMAVGDIDGDGLDEAVFNAAASTGHFTFFMDDQRAGSEMKGAHQHGSAWQLGMAVATLDVDGDGVKEVLSGSDLLDYSANTGVFTHKGTLPYEAIDEECSTWDTFGLYCWGDWVPIYKLDHALSEVYATGDLNGDFREDVVVRRGWELQIWRMDETGAFAKRHHLAVSGRTAPAPALVAANVDKDSLILRYTGQSELLFSKPKVMAVMAAPPTWAGIGQNVDESGTTFGRTSSIETEQTEAMGFTTGFSIGYGQDVSIFGIKLGEFEVTASFEYAMDWTSSTGSSFETSYAFTSGPGEDKVIFTVIPMDVYYYEVVSSGDASDIGRIISINVPREPQTLAVTREFYNAHNGDATDIDETVLNHQVGNPWSYPNEETKKDLMAEYGGWENPMMVGVGQGQGTATLTIAANQSQGRGMEYNFDAKVEVVAGAGGAKVGVSAGFHYGAGYSVTMSQGFFMEGTIGEIPADYYNGDLTYRVGMFAYPYEGPDGHQFIVVNYWVAE